MMSKYTLLAADDDGPIAMMELTNHGGHGIINVRILGQRTKTEASKMIEYFGIAFGATHTDCANDNAANVHPQPEMQQ